MYVNIQTDHMLRLVGLPKAYIKTLENKWRAEHLHYTAGYVMLWVALLGINSPQARSFLLFAAQLCTQENRHTTDTFVRILDVVQLPHAFEFPADLDMKIFLQIIIEILSFE